MATIDDTVNPGAPPGYANAANVINVPNYLSGVFLPDRTKAASFPPENNSPAVSFAFPEPKYYSTRMVIPK